MLYQTSRGKPALFHWIMFYLNAIPYLVCMCFFFRLPFTEAVCQARVLCKLCHSLQDCAEQISGAAERPHPSTEIPQQADRQTV